MSIKNRERRTAESGGGSKGSGSEGGGGAWNYLSIALALVAIGLGFVAWTDGKKINDSAMRLVDIDQKLLQLQTQVANAAKAKPAPQQGPDPNKVYAVKTDVGPTKGNPTAPIVIAEFSDYQ